MMTKKEFQNALKDDLCGHPNIYHLIIIFDKKVNGSF